MTDYKDIDEKTNRFIILRHDIEFSPKRAYDLAKLEFESGVSSSFFFQISNRAYNILAKRNIMIIKDILNMGHKLGLHFHLNGSDDIDEIKNRIKYEIDIMSHVLNTKIDRFSFHRPPSFVLENNIEIPGIINAYNPMYFTFVKNSENLANIDYKNNIKYIADSRNEWSYIDLYEYPNEDFFKTYPKIQILCHPYSWTSEGYQTLDNLKSLIKENKQEFLDILNTETKYVKEYMDEL